VDWIVCRYSLAQCSRTLGGAHVLTGGSAKLASNNCTGTHAIYVSRPPYEIIYHVATYIPVSKTDSQQVERKRHIGNNVVNIVFLEEGALFDPTTITTNFTRMLVVSITKHRSIGEMNLTNHAHRHLDVYFVVSVDVERTLVTGTTHYWIEIAVKEGVADFGPSLSCPPVVSAKDLSSFLIPAGSFDSSI
jgi:hypothetical protein